MNRNSAIIRIILWALVALVLLAVMLWLMKPTEKEYAAQHPDPQPEPEAVDLPVEELATSFGSDKPLEPQPQVEAPQPAVPVQAGLYEAQNITKIDIEWLSGSVLIQGYEGTSVQFGDDYSGNQAKYMMTYDAKNERLTISYADGFSLLALNLPEKNLTVLVPQGLIRELDITTASADVTVENAQITDVEVETASGEIHLQNLTARDVSATSASGDVTGSDLTATELSAELVSGKGSFSGDFQEVDTESVSGDVLIVAAELPRQMDCSSVSGGIEVQLSPSQTVTVSLESISGDLILDYPNALERRDDAMYEFETTSGDVKITTIQ